MSANQPFVRIEVDGIRYGFARLGWLERNRAVNSAVHVRDAIAELRPLEFGESLLVASLREFERDGQVEAITEAWWQRLTAPLGDQLLAIAVRLNRREPRELLPVPRADGTIDVAIDERVFTLTPWTWGVRNQILGRAVRDHQGAGLDAAAFHEHALFSMCTAIDGALPASDWLHTLDSDIGDALLGVALEASALDSEHQRELARVLREGRPHDGITLYRLCKEFGWTPAQVRAQSARDIDTLVTVHAASTEAATGPRSMADIRPRAATPAAAPWRPDDTVIVFEDDDPAAEDDSMSGGGGE